MPGRLGFAALAVAMLVATSAYALAGDGPGLHVAGTSPSLASDPVQSERSANWAGYLVTGAPGSVSAVEGSWVEPSVDGGCPAAARAASIWVGIDGDGTSAVEQVGTELACSGGVAHYMAWYELYPAPAIVLTSLAIHPGDRIMASVAYETATGVVTTNLTDRTTGASVLHRATAPDAPRASAEWIVEAPSRDAAVALADFDAVTWSAAGATVSGTSAPAGHFPTVAEVTMTNAAGTRMKAQPSALSGDGSDFSVAWCSGAP